MVFLTEILAESHPKWRLKYKNSWSNSIHYWQHPWSMNKGTRCSVQTQNCKRSIELLHPKYLAAMSCWKVLSCAMCNCCVVSPPILLYNIILRLSNAGKVKRMILVWANCQLAFHVKQRYNVVLKVLNPKNCYSEPNYFYDQINIFKKVINGIWLICGIKLKQCGQRCHMYEVLSFTGISNVSPWWPQCMSVLV